jgi:alpha-galactosidase
MKTLGLKVSVVVVYLITSRLSPSQDAGYGYVNIDDCYAEKNRTNGKIVEGMASLLSVFCSLTFLQDQVRFKSGMRNLTDQLHSMG